MIKALFYCVWPMKLRFRLSKHKSTNNTAYPSKPVKRHLNGHRDRTVFLRERERSNDIEDEESLLKLNHAQAGKERWGTCGWLIQAKWDQFFSLSWLPSLFLMNDLNQMSRFPFPHLDPTKLQDSCWMLSDIMREKLPMAPLRRQKGFLASGT